MGSEVDFDAGPVRGTIVSRNLAFDLGGEDE